MGQARQYVNLPSAESIEIDVFDELTDIHTALPSDVCSAIDPNFFKSANKETFRSAVQRASAVYRADFLRYRPLGGSTAFSSPSIESPPSSSRESVAQRKTLYASDLRTSAIRRKALYTAVQSVVNVEISRSVKRFFPWNGSLEQIRSYFGRAAASYFSLIRLLFILNVFLTLIVFFFLVLPYLFLSSAPNTPIQEASECPKKIRQLESLYCNGTRLLHYLQCSRDYRQNLADSISNSSWIAHITAIVRGQGYLSLSPLYYGYYTDILNEEPDTFPGGVLYFSVVAIVFLVSFAMLLVLSYKSVITNGPHRTEDFHYRFSSVIFTGWDYITQGRFSSDMRRATIRRFFKTELERAKRREEADKLSGFARIRVWFLRGLFMIVSLAIIVGSVIVILISSSCSQILLEDTAGDSNEWLTSMLADFLSPIVVVLLNTFQPDIFVALAKFENYAPETEVKLILFRLILSRFATVITFMVPLLGFQLKDACPVKSKSKNVHMNATFNATSDFSCAVIKLEQSEIGQKSYCWEQNIGEQLYKIILTDLVSTVILTFLYSYLRRLAVEKLGRLPSLAFLKAVGRREFELPVEIINLFYIQTICWMGIYFMPLLPVFAALTRLALFYMKRWDLFENTFLTWRVRAAEFVDGFYAAYLCGCFFVALTFTGYASSVMMSSPGCGPFGMSNDLTALNSVFNSIATMSPSSVNAADTLGHPLVAGSCVTVVCFVAICCHLFALSTKRRVKAIKQLIGAEQHIRDYYFKQIANTRSVASTFIPSNTSTLASNRYIGNGMPSTYGPELAVGSGIYDFRRQFSRF